MCRCHLSAMSKAMRPTASNARALLVKASNMTISVEVGRVASTTESFTIISVAFASNLSFFGGLVAVISASLVKHFEVGCI